MILSECPACHVKQALKNKHCKCGEDLDKAKRSKRVKFWIIYRLPDGKQKKESVNGMEGLDGYSLVDAKTALSKRQIQKAENRILEIHPDSKMTFVELAKWHLNLEKVKALKSFWLVELCLKKFNLEFGDRVVNSAKLADLENYQAKRLKLGSVESFEPTFGRHIEDGLLYENAPGRNPRPYLGQRRFKENGDTAHGGYDEGLGSPDGFPYATP